jgi:ATPase subunit of ABC transporter with duplicated ATPase domains
MCALLLSLLVLWLCHRQLDEPTNHLDMGTIDTMAEAIRSFNGCVVVVSHDVSFLINACSELWTVDKGKVQVLYRPPTSDDNAAAVAGVDFVDAMHSYLQTIRVE